MTTPSLTTLRGRSIVLITGFVGIALELAVARLMAPDFGSSITLWAELISAVLLGMALGYGLLAARIRRGPAFWLLATAIGAGTLPHIAPPLASVLLTLSSALGAGIYLTLLVLPLSAAVAAVFPLVLDASPRETSTGSWLAVSTIGSLLGSLFTTVVGLPLLGVTGTFRALAAVCILAALLTGRRSWFAVAASAGLLMLPVASSHPWYLPKEFKLSFDRSSIHQRLRIWDGNGNRYLFLNDLPFPHTLRPSDGRTTHGYYDFFALGTPLSRPGEGYLFLGTGGGEALSQLARREPSSAIVGVDLDPLVIQTSREQLGLNAYPQIEWHAEDARVFLKRETRRFRMIAVDLFGEGIPPGHCATREFFELVRTRLAPGGVMILNALAFSRADPAWERVRATLEAAFPSVDALDVGLANTLWVAFGDVPTTALGGRLAEIERDPRYAQIASRAIRVHHPLPAATAAPFSDEYAESDRVFEQSLRRIVARAFPERFSPRATQ